MAIRGPSASKSRAYAYRTYSPPGMCMEYVFQCIAAPVKHGLADANAGWAKSKARHTDKAPPLGVPVYWAGGAHGHVAYSIGGGRVRSTDWPRKGQVGDCTIDQLTKAWGLTYRGWSADYGGTPIPGLGGGGFNAGNLRLGRRSAEAQTFNAKVWAWLGKADPAWCTANRKAWQAESAGVFGAMSQRAMRRAYAVLNKRDPKAWPASQTTNPPPAWPGPAFLRAIGCP